MDDVIILQDNYPVHSSTFLSITLIQAWHRNETNFAVQDIHPVQRMTIFTYMQIINEHNAEPDLDVGSLVLHYNSGVHIAQN